MNTCIFLVLKPTLGRRLGSVLWIFKHVDLLVDLFNSCQLHTSYTKYVKLFLKVFDQGKFVTICLVTSGVGGVVKKVINGDIGEEGLKFDIFAVASFLNDPYGT